MARGVVVSLREVCELCVWSIVRGLLHQLMCGGHFGSSLLILGNLFASDFR